MISFSTWEQVINLSQYFSQAIVFLPSCVATEIILPNGYGNTTLNLDKATRKATSYLFD